MLDRNHLKLLLALAESGSLTAAARALHLTQSALSHSIKKLEVQLGLQLWEKQGRNLRLTPAGEYVLGLAREIEPRFTEAEQALAAIAGGKKGKLRIGMECHPCYEWLMSVVPGYLQAWPDVDLDVIQKFRFDGLEALANHHIDLLITSDPLEKEALVNIPVLDYELLLAVSSVSESVLPTYVKPRALLDQTLYSFPVDRSRLDVFSYFLLPANIEPAKHQHIENIEVMLQLVASGRGVCTLPDWLLAKYGKSFSLRGMKLGREGVKKSLYLVLRKKDLSLQYLAAFIESAKNVKEK